MRLSRFFFALGFLAVLGTHARADDRLLWGSSVGYKVFQYVFDMGVADFDDDGWQDVALIADNGKKVIVLSGKSGGLFEAVQDTFTLPISLEHLVVGDVTGDGDEDLVLSGATAGDLVRVLPGLPGVAFGPAIVLGTGSAADIADVTGDNVPDIVAGQTIYPGDGLGGFGAPIAIAWPASRALTLGHFNVDGHRDIASAYTDPIQGNGIGVILGLGGGAFGPADFHPLQGVFGIATGDLDEDGALDLVPTNGWMRGHGDGAFDPLVRWGTENERYPSVGDVDDDGHLDVATTNLFYDASFIIDSRVNVRRGNGDGTMEPPTRLPGAFPSYTTVLVDLNHNAGLDLVAAPNLGRLLTFFSNPDGSFGRTIEADADSSPVSIAIGELTGDSRLDVAVAIQVPPMIRILPGNGDGSLGSPLDLAVPAGVSQAAVGDLDGNGTDDLVSLSSSTVSVFLGLGGGAYGPRTDYVGGGPSLVLGDLNGDGRDDVVVGPVTVRRFLSTPAGGLDPPTAHAGGSDAFDLGIGLADADAYPDVLVARPGHVSYFPGGASGVLGARVDRTVTSATLTAVAAAFQDVDADGDPDAVYATEQSGLVHLGNGAGLFSTVSQPGTNRASSIAVGDLNEDGRMDLVTTEYFAGGVGVFPGTGGGHFQDGLAYGSGSYPRDAACADMDADGHVDVVVANQSWGTVSVLLNTIGEVGVGGRPRIAGPGFALAIAGANPTRGDVAIRFRLPAAGPVALDLLDVAGRRVGRMDLGALAAGDHAARFERPAGVRAGLYFIRLVAGPESANVRVVFLD